MTTPALLPSSVAPIGLAKWALGSVVLVIFSLVVLSLLRDRGYDPVGAIVRMIPMPPPPTRASAPGPDAASAAAAMS